MAVIAMFTYEIRPGRMGDFLAKLRAAADARFASPTMPKSVRVFRKSTAGSDAERIVMHIEYDDRAAYDARTAFEAANFEWQRLFRATLESPERLISLEVLAELKFDDEA